MGRKPAVEQPLNDTQIVALRELIEAVAAETVATDRARRALVAAHDVGVSWGNLGIALNVPRETARGRVKVAQKYVADTDAATTQLDEPAEEAPAITVPGPMPVGAN